MLAYLKKAVDNENSLFLAALTGFIFWGGCIVAMATIAMWWVWQHVRICII